MHKQRCRLFWAHNLFFFFPGCVISPVVGASGGFGREISALNTLLSKEVTEFV